MAFGKWGGAPVPNPQRTGRALGNFVSVSNPKVFRAFFRSADRLLGEPRSDNNGTNDDDRSGADAATGTDASGGGDDGRGR